MIIRGVETVKIIKHLNQNMHLRWKATLPIIAAIAFGVVATIIVMMF